MGQVIIIWQRLVRRAGGRGRVALREYLVFDETVRNRFLAKPALEWVGIVKDLMEESICDPTVVARSMSHSARTLIQKGIVDERDVSRFIEDFAQNQKSD